jgi:ribonuclease HII
MPPKIARIPLKPFYDEDHPDVVEIALDECGRGPLFGRVYAAAVVLPRDPAAFDTTRMKDSKLIHSKKQMKELAEYIRSHAVATSVQYQEAEVVDRVNILQADMLCMHACIRDMLASSSVVSNKNMKNMTILVDGNYFKPFSVYDETTESMYMMPHTTIEQGDGKYASIAAASILAKYERDTYIEELCQTYPVLRERYALDRNMGYGTAAHLDGIARYGITQWHRKTFGRCKQADVVKVV